MPWYRLSRTTHYHLPSPQKNICDHDAPRPSSSVQVQWGSWRHGTEREEPAREPKVEKKGSNSIMRGGGNNKPLPTPSHHHRRRRRLRLRDRHRGGGLGVLCTAYDATCIHPSTSSTTSGSAALWDDFTRHRRGKTPEWGGWTSSSVSSATTQSLPVCGAQPFPTPAASLTVRSSTPSPPTLTKKTAYIQNIVYSSSPS